MWNENFWSASGAVHFSSSNESVTCHHLSGQRTRPWTKLLERHWHRRFYATTFTFWILSMSLLLFIRAFFPNAKCLCIFAMFYRCSKLSLRKAMWGSNFRRIAGWPCRKVTESFISDEVNTFWVFTVPQTRQGLDRNLILQCFDVFLFKTKTVVHHFSQCYFLFIDHWPVQKFVARRCWFISFDQ